MGDVHEGRWDGSPGRFTLEEWHRSCLVHLHGAGMPEGKGQCKLPVRDPDGHINRHAVHAAAARINQVDAPPDKIARARSALRAAYRECGEEAPIVAKVGGDRPFRDEVVEKVRRVRTPEGARYYDAPIGTPITAAMKVAARTRNRGRGTPRGEDRSAPPPRQGNRGPAGASVRGANARPQGRQAVSGGRGGRQSGASVPRGAAQLPEDRAERAKVYRQAVKEAQNEHHLDLILERLRGDDMVGKRVKAGVEAQIEARRAAMKGDGKEKAPEPPPAPPKPEEVPGQAPPDLDPPEAEKWYAEEIRSARTVAEIEGLKTAFSKDKRLGAEQQHSLAVLTGKRRAQVAKPVKTGDRVEVEEPGEEPRAARVVRRRGVAAGKVGVARTGEGVEVVPSHQVRRLQSASEIQEVVTQFNDRVEDARRERDLDRIANDVKADKRVPGPERSRILRLVDEKKRELGIEIGETPRDKAVVRIKAKIAALTDPEDQDALADLADEIMNDRDVDRRTAQALMNAADDRLRELFQAKATITADDRRAMYRRKVADKAQKIREWEKSPDNSPAAKALAKGKEIDQLTPSEGVGLLEYAEAHRDRYTVDKVEGGVSETWSITDKKSGRKFFFKSTSNNGPADMFGDGINEYLAAAFGQAALGKQAVLGVDFVRPPSDGKNPIIRMDHLDEWGKSVGAKKVHYDTYDRDALEKPASNPRQVMAIHIYDYLVNQQDRHEGNYGWADTPQGRVLIPLDNGATFHAFNARMQVKGVEQMTYQDWHESNGVTDIISFEAKLAYRAKGMGEREMRADATALIEQFKKVDADKILADLMDKIPNMDEYERKHAEAAVIVWKSRLAQIDAAEVARKVETQA